MAGDVGVIWGGDKEEYFLMTDLTAKSLICPSGMISAVEGSTNLPAGYAEVRF
jgi:hypothetical protein